VAELPAVGQRAQPLREHQSSLLTRMQRGIWGYIFIAPWVVLYVAFGLYPLLLSFYLTFFKY